MELSQVEKPASSTKWKNFEWVLSARVAIMTGQGRLLPIAAPKRHRASTSGKPWHHAFEYLVFKWMQLPENFTSRLADAIYGVL